MDNLTKQEKEQALKEYEISQNKRVLVGKTIVVFIASINIILAVLSYIIDFNNFKIAQIVFSIALISGVTWVRYFFAIGAAINAFSIFYTLWVVGSQISFPVWVTAVLVIQLVYFIASCILLFTNKNISEYMYARKNR